MCVLLFDVSNGCSSSIKEINRLILERNVKPLLLRKTDFSKLGFFWKENLKKCSNFKERYKVYSGKRLY